MRRPLIASLFTIAFAFAGCVDPPPPPPKAPPPPPPPVTAEPTSTAEPEPPRGEGTEATPYHLIPGRRQPVEITAPLLRSAGVALQARSDMILTWAGTDPVRVQSSASEIQCPKSPCVVPVAHVDLYEIRAESGPKQTISVSALPLPKAPLLSPGKAVVLKPKPVADGDPRGAIADASLEFMTSGQRMIDLRPLGKKRANDLDGLSAKIHVRVFGEKGRLHHEASLSPDIGGAIRVTFDAPAGPYTMRLIRDRDELADAVEVKLHKDEGTQPGTAGVGSAPKRDGFASLAVGAKVDVEVAPPETPKRAYFDLPPESDLFVFRPDQGSAPSPSVSIYTEWPGNSRSHMCPGHIKLCPVPWPHPGLYQIFAPPQAQALTGAVEVVALPIPKAAGTLSVGTKVDVTTESLAKDDPRGAIAEVALDAPSPGKYKVIVGLIDSKPPPAEAGHTPPGPDLSIFALEPTAPPNFVEATTTLDPTQTVATMIFTAKKAGPYRLRVGMGDASERKPAAALPRKMRVEYMENKVVSSD